MDCVNAGTDIIQNFTGQISFHMARKGDGGDVMRLVERLYQEANL